MLELPDMQEKEKLFYFMYGLQYWDCNDLKGRKVQDIDEAIVVAEDIMEFRSETMVKKNSWGDHSTPEPHENQDAPKPLNSKGKEIKERNKKRRTEGGQVLPM